MAKRNWTFDHTADIGIAAEADTLVELFESLAESLAQQICSRSQVKPAQQRAVTVEAEDAEALAVDFLTQVMNIMQTDLFVVSSIQVTCADSNSLSALLIGEPYDSTRHEFAQEIKAVTYHLLEIAEHAGQWSGQVILDV